MSGTKRSTVVINTGTASGASQSPGIGTSLLTANNNGVAVEARGEKIAVTIDGHADGQWNSNISDQAIVEESLNAGAIAELREQIAERNTLKKELASLEQKRRRLEAIRAENLRRLDAFLEESAVVLDFMQKELAKSNPSHSIGALLESVEVLPEETICGLNG
ncbi:hypothetical protein MMC22_001922 [Lobaria immixta]|nr:hypothetical protein [Lobaria immixta]